MRSMIQSHFTILEFNVIAPSRCLRTGQAPCSGQKTGKCDVHGNVRVDRVEMDFFMLALMEHPAVLIGKANVKHNGAMAALKCWKGLAAQEPEQLVVKG